MRKAACGKQRKKSSSHSSVAVSGSKRARNGTTSTALIKTNEGPSSPLTATTEDRDSSQCSGTNESMHEQGLHNSFTSDDRSINSDDEEGVGANLSTETTFAAETSRPRTKAQKRQQKLTQSIVQSSRSTRSNTTDTALEPLPQRTVVRKRKLYARHLWILCLEISEVAYCS